VPAPISGPSQPLQPKRTGGEKLPPQLQTEGFQSILSGLGINPKDIMSLALLKGLQVDLKFNEAQLIEINQEQTELLNALGINNAHLAIVLNDDNEIDRIRKRLKEIKEKTMDPESLSVLSQAFGIPVSDETTVFSDKAGGVIVIKSGLKEIFESIKRKEDETEH